MATLQYAVALRTAQCDAIATVLSTNFKLKIYSGAMPATVADAATGTLLCTMSSLAFAAAATGAIAKTGTWSGTGTAGASTGTNAGYFRLTTSADVEIVQGDITATAGGGAMTLDNVSIAQNQTVTCSGFTVTAGNA